MIRIDDDTYIDDTLVTCAEYQLFIDEMREQGRYFQPDHWTSYQFPKGQARMPIVGVRFDDANAFCEWLTKREAGEWSFRLPTFSIAEQYPLHNPVQSPLGYWTVGQNDEALFVWVGPTPVNPRNIDGGLDRDIYLDRAIERTLALDLAIVLDHARTIDFTRALRAIRNRYRAAYHHRYDPDPDRTLTRDLALTRDLVRDLARDPTRDRNLADSALDLYLDIYTLQERIAGRSPAFEGIRLVKERKP
jgi:hypothetical protein